MTMQTMLANPLASIVLMHADDLLMLGHVQSDWTGLAPILEEDIAASSMAQDDLSHALVLYQYLAEEFDLDPDAIAFDRDPADYRCCNLTTVPDEFDWAVSMCKRWLLSTYTKLGLDRLALVDEGDLGDRCARLRDESAIHVAHLGAWMIRLGTGSTESNERMQAALNLLAEEAGMMFEPPDLGFESDEGFCCGRGEMFDEWATLVGATLSEAGLQASFTLPDQAARGGRRGEHAGHFSEQHAEMTEVRRAEPATAW
ncbi:MAG: phenylacetate-CoA oxygenase subunit PaaC [Phycisphaerales bacterium]|jgi:ring-1,2-phenylacetyl-CoA epoxidase subunit PaaC|nr:phenylacetate-CoA oxygenase subunit PaaC [Phycisphaerales bacterium]